MDGLSYQNITYLNRDEVPERFDSEKENRHALRAKTGMWAVVDKTWTKALADEIGSRSCLEVFAGRGWLAKALVNHGVDIIATSRFSRHDGSGDGGLVHDVIDMSAFSAVQAFEFEVLIMCWPIASEDAINAVEAARRLGKTFDIIFIGEPYSDNSAFLSGTASDSFFERCEVVKEIPEYRAARGKQGIDVCYVMRVKSN